MAQLRRSSEDRWAWVEIDLDAIRSNTAELQTPTDMVPYGARR